jgi:farnesyl-diphosphate farnesyltransferase
VSPELQSLLRDTSRSFYLTLRVLPASVRPQIGLAYLLARTTDTIADTELVPVAERVVTLTTLAQRIDGTLEAPLDLQPVLDASVRSASPAERQLLERTESALSLLRALSAADLSDVRAVLATITSGQILDLQRFATATPTQPVALRSDIELDDYTYRVAGCVGEFWTRMTRRHCFPEVRLDDARFLEKGIRFGKGLQLVNILRDLPRDLRQGRCYLPAPELASVGLQPTDLLDPNREPQLRPVYNRWRDQAEESLAAGWAYTLTLPHSQRRLRLACAWPILIGGRTLARLRTGRILDPAVRIKIPRSEVRSLLLGTLWRLPFRAAWEGQWSRSLRTG